jgi:hypothetical protein
VREIVYDFHGALRARIRGLSPFSLKAFNCLHAYFESGPGIRSHPRPGVGVPGRAAESSAAVPDLEVEIGPFEPDLSGCANVDHTFYLRRGYVFFRGSDKGLAWKAEVLGLDRPEGAVRVRFEAPLRNRLRFPWCLFPDLVLNLYVLNPLLELMLWKRGLRLIHSAGVEKGGRACLVAGRGGAHKTTFTMALLRRGWRLLGDDLVLLRGGEVLCFPTVAQELDYLTRRQPTEEMGFLAKAGLFRHLAADLPFSLPVAASARPAALNLVRVRDIPSPVVRQDWDLDAAVESLVANHRMERITYVGFKVSTGAFLDAYEYAFPEAGFRGQSADLAAALRGALRDAALRVIDVPHRWDPRNLEHLLEA